MFSDADRGKKARELQAKGQHRSSRNSCDLQFWGWLYCGSSASLHAASLTQSTALCSGWIVYNGGALSNAVKARDVQTSLRSSAWPKAAGRPVWHLLFFAAPFQSKQNHSAQLCWIECGHNGDQLVILFCVKRKRLMPSLNYIPTKIKKKKSEWVTCLKVVLSSLCAYCMI